MSKAWIGAALAAIALAGCTPGTGNVADNGEGPNVTVPVDETVAEENAVSGNDGEPVNALAVVLEMPDYTRNQTFVRAIMDAKFRCDGVVKSERVKDVNKLPAWRADCKDGKSHILTVTPDGTVNIMSRAD